MSAPTLDSPLAKRYEPAAAHSVESMRERLMSYRLRAEREAQANRERELRHGYSRRRVVETDMARARDNTAAYVRG